MSKSAKPDTWMPLVIGDYLKDTTRLTTEQHGAYLLLIMSYWVDGPPINDDEELASITGLDRKSWSKNRAKIERFFRIENGHWRHKRIDEELERWAAKKAVYSARAAAGGLAKAAKSTSQAGVKQQKAGEKGCLNSAPQPASTEVEGPSGHSTLCRQNGFLGPEEVRNAFLSVKSEQWVASYIDRCAWQDLPCRALLAANAYALSQIDEALRALAREKHRDTTGLTVIPKDRAA